MELLVWTTVMFLAIHRTKGETCSASEFSKLLPTGFYGFRLLNQKTVGTLRYCADLCADNGGLCEGFSYRRKPEGYQCLLLTHVTFPQASSEFELVPFTAFISRIRDFRFLVFRASAFTGQKAYNAFVSTDVSNEGEAALAHDLSQSIARPYKHPLLETHYNKIKQITLQLWQDGGLVVELRFDAEGADKLQWFSYSRLLASSYSDLKADGSTEVLRFTHRHSSAQRSFWISKYGGNCQDGGWLAVIDGPDDCPWGIFTNYPRFLYSSVDMAVFWNSLGTSFADDLVILADMEF